MTVTMVQLGGKSSGFVVSVQPGSLALLTSTEILGKLPKNCPLCETRMVIKPHHDVFRIHSSRSVCDKAFGPHWVSGARQKLLPLQVSPRPSPEPVRLGTVGILGREFFAAVLCIAGHQKCLQTLLTFPGRESAPSTSSRWEPVPESHSF